MSASDLADEYDAVMADVIAIAGSCSQADWTTSCINEQRSVGVVFDHIAELNPEVVRWVREFLNGRPVEMTLETVAQRNGWRATARRDCCQPEGRLSPHLRVHTFSDRRAAEVCELLGGYGGRFGRELLLSPSLVAYSKYQHPQQ